jgi:C-terminal processing protease CtpA/Prc
VDGSQFHGIGVVPDFPVEYTAADLAAGRDRDLEVAIQVLHGQTP